MFKGLFVEVILPVSINRLLTYRVPEDLEDQVAIGKRVVVPLGRNKLYSGIVCSMKDSCEEVEQVKPIQAVLDESPILHTLQLDFWFWMVDYYMCHPGEVMNAAIPSALRLQSETMLTLSDDARKEVPDWMDGDEEVIYDTLLDQESVTVQDIQRLFPGKSAPKKLKRLVEQGIVMISEEIGERYKPLKETRLRLHDRYSEEKQLEGLFKQFEHDSRKQKQLEALLFFLKVLYDDKSKNFIRKKDLKGHDEISLSSIQTLVRNGILEEFEVVVDRIRTGSAEIVPPAILAPPQQEAMASVKKAWVDLDTVLLHGVTSSGKTEIYIHLIQEALEKGEQVLYLLPEIALTTQIIHRLRKHFGDKVGVYHSRYSSNERVEVWNHVLNYHPSDQAQPSQIILGARSALFLPFSKLGLVIVDEEHDSSYKQHDPAPRYHARDASMVLARQQGAKVVLGSATPSLESYYNAKQGKYGLVRLTERFGGMQMPEIILSDIKEAALKKTMKSHFSPLLIDAISSAFKAKEQVILFQNRRGFSSYLECMLCNWIPHCKHCSVTLTYHKSSQNLKCHYCGYTEQVPAVCRQCGDAHVVVKGFGTEKIEEEIGLFFPDNTIGRLDLDTATTRASFQRILSDFEERNIDMLVGTQMVSKGLDFDHVTTVGIMDADQMLNFPDFRAHERSFQLMSQVSGRSGRKNKRGLVVIQTRQPGHWVIRDVIAHDYESFYHREIEGRSHFGYPPYSRLIELTLRHKDENEVHEAAVEFVRLLKQSLTDGVHGPHIPLVSRIRNRYLRTVLIRIPRHTSASAVKSTLRNVMNQLQSAKDLRSLQIVIDVDPV